MVRKVHKLLWNNRMEGTISGVIEVISFDPQEIVLDTEYGLLIIKGGELKVIRLALENGEVDITGRVDGMLYTDSGSRGEKKQGFFLRLFQ